jgi:hypothetical protein
LSVHGYHHVDAVRAGLVTIPRADRERAIAVIPLGALDDDPGVGAGRHIFVADKAAWFEIADDLPQYPDRPPA